jgi:hypothetical protein
MNDLYAQKMKTMYIGNCTTLQNVYSFAVFQRAGLKRSYIVNNISNVEHFRNVVYRFYGVLSDTPFFNNLFHKLTCIN